MPKKPAPFVLGLCLDSGACTIQQAAADAVRIGKALGVKVEFTFNGFYCCAGVGEAAAAVVGRYRAAQAEEDSKQELW